MKPTPEQIDLIDKLFLIVIRPNKGLTPGPDLICKELKSPQDIFQFLYNTMCEIGHEEKILVAEQMGNGDYEIVSIDYFKSKQFIDQGGFNGHFEKDNTLHGVHGDTNVILNSGKIENLVQNVRSNNANGLLNQNISKPINPKKPKTFSLKIVYWIATICLALIALYGLIKGLLNI